MLAAPRKWRISGMRIPDLTVKGMGEGKVTPAPSVTLPWRNSGALCGAAHCVSQQCYNIVIDLMTTCITLL
jgi:hypothetical protein